MHRGIGSLTVEPCLLACASSAMHEIVLSRRGAVEASAAEPCRNPARALRDVARHPTALPDTSAQPRGLGR